MAKPVARVLDLHVPSKEAPPPAYSPHGRPDMSSSPGPPAVLVDRSSLASLVTTQQALEAVDASSPDDYPRQSSISLRINTSVRVSSNNNHVCLSETPAAHANAIARAVVRAIHESSSGQCGIPMIDEDGRPRPVRIHVDAGLEVHGEGNVVGGDDLVGELLRRRTRTRTRTRTGTRTGTGDDETDISPACFKRRRSQ
ncbi:hypothetical protein E4U53_005606 [Claviceps sorghi]|nr:hypothetical protein E4U53_005606 [Claviceps sorghi]